MKILLAVDGSECGDAAVRHVASFPWPGGTEVRVISAAEPPAMMAMTETWGPPVDYYDMLEKAAEERARHAVERASADLKGTDLRVTGEVIRGLPKEAILHEAERWVADLIVLGSHGYRGIKRIWLGSVSQAVAAHAHCSVMIVRRPEAAQPA
ncbi:MAG: universal stress protein [Candidatus Polarisedimenticolia bacterium]